MDPHRLANGQQDEQRHRQARQAHHDESRAPVEGLIEPSAADETQQDADRHSGGEDRQRCAASAIRKQIGDHGVGCGPGSRLADGDAHASRQKLAEAAGQAAERGHTAPHREACGNDIAARGFVGQSRDRQAGDGVEEGEAQAGQQSKLAIAQMKFMPDRLHQYRQNLAIDEVEDIDEHQDAQNIVGVAGAASLRAISRYDRRGHPGLLPPNPVRLDANVNSASTLSWRANLSIGTVTHISIRR